MTPHDRYQRRIDLAGEIKQADELVHECRVDVEAKQKALALAEQALKRQLDLRGEKHDEARRLAKEAHDDFMSLVPEPESVSAVMAEIEASFAGPAPVPMDAASLEWAQGEAERIVAADPELQAIDDIDPTFKSGDDGISATNIFENPVYTNGISRALDAAQNP